MPQGESNAIRHIAAETCNLIPELVGCVTRCGVSPRIRIAYFAPAG